MNRHEMKQEARKARLLAAADRAEARADAAYSRADLREEASGIPFGQPILVGHHSEKRHRRAIEKADNAMRRSVEESKRAGELRAKAENVGSGGISSDDPDAIAKLRAELARLSARHELEKKVNRALRRKNTDEGDAALAALGFDPDQISVLRKPDHAGRVGVPPFVFSNRTANMRRIEQRIRELEKASERQTREADLGCCRYVANAEENRLQFIFDGKPDADIRAILKSHGFRWAPSQGAWQRKWTANAAYSAKMAVAKITEGEGA